MLLENTNIITMLWFHLKISLHAWSQDVMKNPFEINFTFKQEGLFLTLMSLHVPRAGFAPFCKALQQTFLGKIKKTKQNPIKNILVLN